MVLCMRLETTSPTTSLRRPAAGCTGAPVCEFVWGMLLLLRSAGRSQFPFASDLLQALGLSHVELKLQLEQLVAEFMLLVTKFLRCQVAYFFGFHNRFPVRRWWFLVRTLELYKHGTQRQLVRSQTHGLSRVLLRDPFHLEQDLARPHHRHPMIRRSLALAHTGFSRLLCDRLVREQADLNLAAALDETGHGHARRLDLTVGNPTRLEHLQPEIAERQLAPAPRLPRHAPALLLTVLHFLWHQHKVSSWLLASGRILRTRLPAAARASWPAGFRLCRPST